MIVEFQKALFTLSLQTLLNHKTGDDQMARVGNMLSCQPLLCLIARAPKNKVVRSKQ